MVAEGICEVNFPRELYLRQGNRFLPHQQLLYHGQLASQVELLKSDEGALTQRNPLLLPVLVRLHVQSVKRYRAMSEPISSKLLRSRVYRPLKKIEPVIGVLVFPAEDHIVQAPRRFFDSSRLEALQRGDELKKNERRFPHCSFLVRIPARGAE